MANDSLSKIDNAIIRAFLRPEKNKPNHFLANTEASMEMFEKNKQSIFTFKNCLYTSKLVGDTTTSFYIRGSNPEISHSDITYKECLMRGLALEEFLTLVIEIVRVKKTYADGQVISVDEKVIKQSKTEIRIPMYVGNAGKTNDKMHCYPEALETGGFFVSKNNLRKFVVLKQDRTCTRARYKKEKNNVQHHCSFNSSPLRYHDALVKPQFINIDLDLSLNKLTVIIKSEKTLPALNVISLVSFLTGFSLSDLKNVLLSRFKFDKRVCDIVNIIFSETENELVECAAGELTNETRMTLGLRNEKDVFEYEKKNTTESQRVALYIKTVCHGQWLIDNKDEMGQELTFQEYLQRVINTLLLPGTNAFCEAIYKTTGSKKRRLKGLLIFYELENLLVAAFQNPIYPNKYHMANRRIATPGTTFENIGFDIVKNIINDYKDQILAHLKSNKNNFSIDFKAHRKAPNVFNNIFNMQDKKNSIVVKPQKSMNFAQRLVLNNLVVFDAAISLTKYFNSQDPCISTWNYFGLSDTPDHGKHVGIHRRLNAGTRINDKDFETHEKLTREIVGFVMSYLEKHSNLEDRIEEDMVNIILVDDSEIYIGSIEQSLSFGLFSELKKKKRNNIFVSNMIDIVLEPIYNKSRLDILLPTEEYRTLRINVGNRIPFMPVYIVEDGKLLIENITLDESFKRKTFTELISLHNFMEYLGPEEFAFSDVCESISLFLTLSLDERKRYSYVSFDNTLNNSVLEAMIFDMGKMPGPRSIFTTAQLKNNIGSIQPDSHNTIEESKYVVSGFQEPCLTNDVLIESKIPKQSFGTHINVLFMAYNSNIEDSFIVNEESVKNGMFVVVNLKLYKGKPSLKNTKTETSNIKMYKNSYAKLDDDFVPKENIMLEMGDALYGDTEAKVKKSNNVYYLQDNSQPYKYLIPGRVDRILLSNDEYSLNIKYTVASLHFLERGHKMSNQCAQKGTVSKVAQAGELPYNQNGVRPDLIMNTLSKLGRKTLNMYYQPIMTNYYAHIPFGEDGKKRLINYKPFSDNDYNTLQPLKDDLKEVYPYFSDYKIDRTFNCVETIFDPYTGEHLKNDVFMGPIYFSRLTQISDEKISYHNRGRLNKHNQPPGGKQKGGALRFGEMEMDILATHGVANLLYEVSKDSIEAQTNVYICQNCTNVATSVTNALQSYYTCLNCEAQGLNPVFEKQNLTKLAKIMINELNFRGVKIHVKNNKTPVLYGSKI